MAITVYGIKNCSTVAKAREWLEQHGVVYGFHDYKTAGIDRVRLEAWCAELGWEQVINRAGMTFRKLADADKVDLTGEKAIGLMLAQPSMIRRPIADLGDRRLVGFKPEVYSAVFA